MTMTKILTYRYAFTLLKMKNAEGRNEYMDLAKEAYSGIKYLAKSLKTSLE